MSDRTIIAIANRAATTIALPPIAYAVGSPVASLVTACAAAVLILFRHRENLMRLRAGTERRLGARA